MRYFIRAIKYFLYLFIIMALLLTILVLLGMAEADPAKIFVGGYSSWWKIALAFAALSAVYPRFGYSTAEVFVEEGIDERIRSIMDARGYKLRSKEGESMVFVKRSPIDRALRLWEDAITITRTENGYSLEGHTKEMVRCRSSILNAISPQE